jgi:Holliday junction resolvase-like predicted endonuclease
MMKRRETGILGEKLARDLLKKRGYRIIDTNYRCPHGEIDIVARKKDQQGKPSRIDILENAVGEDS